MDPAGLPALIEAIKHMHGCSAKHVATEHVHERAPNGETVWQGDVEAFELAGHPSAKRAYAWSEATTGTKRRGGSRWALPNGRGRRVPPPVIKRSWSRARARARGRS